MIVSACTDFQVGATSETVPINYEHPIFSSTLLESHTYFHLFQKVRGGCEKVLLLNNMLL